MEDEKFVNKEYLENSVKQYDEKVVGPIRNYIVKLPSPPTATGNYQLHIDTDGTATWVLV